jgi:hypothetical protein
MLLDGVKKRVMVKGSLSPAQTNVQAGVQLMLL